MDACTGITHSFTTTAANEHDLNQAEHLLHGDEAFIFADAGYISDRYKRGARALGMGWEVNDKRKPKKNMSTSQKKRNRQNASIRARVEHCFRVIKCQFGYKKTRYKGLEKNRTQVFSLLSLTNVYLQRKHLMG